MVRDRLLCDPAAIANTHIPYLLARYVVPGCLALIRHTSA
jgi:hypothetical protein